MSVTTGNIYSVMDKIGKNNKSTQTIDKNNKIKISSPYSVKTSTPVQTNVVSEPEEEIFDAPKKTVSTPQRAGSNVNPYYTYSGSSASKGESALLKLKREMEEKSASDPNFKNTNEAKYIKGVANEVRKNYGLSEAEHGSGVSSGYVNALHNLDGKTNYIDPENAVKSGNNTIDKNVSTALNLYNIKKTYERLKSENPNFDTTDFAKYLHDRAETIRRNNNLPEALKGTGITADELLAKINYVIDSPEFKAAKADTDYMNVLKRYDNEKYALLTTEDKKRAILSYLDAQEKAKKIIQPQADQAISDTINSQDTAAIRRGMYGQVPASVLKANALANTQNQINSQINNMAFDLVDRDNALATEEFNIRQQNKKNKLTAFEQLIASEREKRDLLKAQAENEAAQKAAEAQSAWEQQKYKDEQYWKDRDMTLEENKFYDDSALKWQQRDDDWNKFTDESNREWYGLGLEEENMRNDYNLGLYEAETDRNYKNNMGQANLIKAYKTGSGSSGSSSGIVSGISKAGAEYIDNYLMPKINNVLNDKYREGTISGKKGAYNFSGMYGMHAYEDVIASQILNSNLDNNDAEILLNMLNISDETIAKYL